MHNVRAACDVFLCLILCLEHEAYLHVKERGFLSAPILCGCGKLTANGVKLVAT